VTTKRRTVNEVRSSFGRLFVCSFVRLFVRSFICLLRCRLFVCLSLVVAELSDGKRLAVDGVAGGGGFVSS